MVKRPFAATPIVKVKGADCVEIIHLHLWQEYAFELEKEILGMTAASPACSYCTERPRAPKDPGQS